MKRCGSSGITDTAALVKTGLLRKWIATLIALLNFAICNAQFDFVVLDDQSIVNQLISTYKVLPESSTTTKLTEAEFELVKKRSKACIAGYNDKIKRGFRVRGEKMKYVRMYQIRALKNYKVQYVPYLNKRGEKEVWINGFCNDFELDWRKDIIHVFDGGNCYFTIQLNLSTDECLAIGTNGYS